MSGKHLEIAEAKAAVRDDRRWCDIGVVTVLDGDDKHYQILKDNAGNAVDVLVGVKLGHTGELFPCRLGNFVGRAGAGGFGLWTIPPVGTEVIVAIPTGEFEADAVIVGQCSSGTVPAALDEDTVVLRAPKGVKIIVADSGSKVSIGVDGGTFQPAVLGNDMEARLSALESKYNGHVHVLPAFSGSISGSTFTASGATTDAPGTSDQQTDTRNIKAQNVEVT